MAPDPGVPRSDAKPEPGRHEQLFRVVESGVASIPSTRRLLWVTLGACIGLVAVSGCGRAVTVAPPDPSFSNACAPYFEALPDELGGERRLTINPETGQTAAWGVPPVVWRCGAATPPGLTRDAQLVEVNGAQWFPEELSDGARFTSVGAQPAIEVTVPAQYPSPVAFLGAFQTPDTAQP